MRWALAIVVICVIANRAAAHVPVTQPCRACHEDKHHGELPADCGSCHTTAAWLPSTFGVAQHAQTKYPLDGKHVATPCGACHLGARPRLGFTIIQSECLDCHDNPHGTKFAAQMVKGGCAECHTTASWQSWRVDHKTWPLAGAHAAVACTACHPGVAASAPASAFRGIPRACDRCHDDVHAGQFRQSAPVKDCATCHTATSFTTAFDHRATRYPLEGVHTELACAKCHPTVELRNGERAVRWRLGFAACGDCHANPHSHAALDCATCHAATSWKLTRDAGKQFDHAATGFALRGAHTSTPCASCHGTAARPSSDCEGCHRDPHRGKTDGACAECHTATAWADVSVLEQHRRTRMPLTGKHALIECTACHKRQGDRAWSDTPVDCYACHSAGYHSAVPDHDPVGGGEQYSRECQLCHVTAAWKPALDVWVAARRSPDHDAWFVLSSGSHRDADCTACHPGPKPTKRVRCDGCHTEATLRTQHRAPVSIAAPACLQCHPRGARR